MRKFQWLKRFTALTLALGMMMTSVSWPAPSVDAAGSQEDAVPSIPEVPATCFGERPEPSAGEKALQKELDAHTPVTDMSLTSHATFYSDGTLVFYRGTYDNAAKHGTVLRDYTNLEKDGCQWSSLSFSDAESKIIGESVTQALVYDFIKPGIPATESYPGMFCDLKNLEYIVGMENLDLTNVKTFKRFFRQCNKLKFVDFSHTLLPSEGVDASEMFSHNLNLVFIDFPDSGGLKVTNAFNMFYRAFLNFRDHILDFRKWDFSECQNASSMLNSVHAKEIIFKDNPFPKLTDMSYMFADAVISSRLDLSTWDLSTVTNMSSCFRQNVSKGIVFGEKVPENLKYIGSCFTNLTCEEELNVSGFGFDNAFLNSMFDNVKTNVIGFDSWTGSVTNATRMFYQAKIKGNIDLSGLDWSSVKNLDDFAHSASDITSIMFGKSVINASEMTGYMNHPFRECDNLKSVQMCIQGTVDGKSAFMQTMFNNCPKLKSVDFTGSDVTLGYNPGIYQMFAGCTALENLDLSWLHWSEVPGSDNVRAVFARDKALSRLVLSSDFYMKKYTGNNSMFYGCTGNWMRLSDEKFFRYLTLKKYIWNYGERNQRLKLMCR